MSRKSIFPTLTLAAFLLLSNFSYGQAKYNFEIGVSYTMATAEYKTTSKYFNYVTNEQADSVLKETIKTKAGIGGLLGHHFRLIKMGNFSSISMSINFMYDILIWEQASSYKDGYNNTASAYETATVRMGLPIGIDYKLGCDAVGDRSKRLTGSFGAGVFPEMLLTSYLDQGKSSFKVQPYIKGEVGIFLGICMKLRGTYTMGKVNYVDYSSDKGYWNTNAILKGKSSFTISLVLMPASLKWKKDEWWN